MGEMCNLTLNIWREVCAHHKYTHRYANVSNNIKATGAYLLIVFNSINHFLRENTFPDELNKFEVIPKHKKLNPLKKEIYRPISLSPHVLTVFERIQYKQIMSYINDLLSNRHNWFSKVTWQSTLPCKNAGKLEKRFR